MITNDLPSPAAVAPPRRPLVLPVWVWPLLAAALVLAMTLIYSGGRGAADIMSAAVTFSALFVIVGLGQMLVITSGPGNVDLSIPAAISLAGAIAMKVMDGSNGMIVAGLAAALGAAMALGVANYLLIRLLRIPPIIATLSSALIVQSIAIAYGRGLKIKPPPAFADFCTGRTLGVSNLALVAAVLRRSSCWCSPVLSMAARWFCPSASSVRPSALNTTPCAQVPMRASPAGTSRMSSTR